MYQLGEGVQQDSAIAAALYQQAVDQGYAQAQCDLGALYQRGNGVQQDRARAVVLFQQAADQGNANAQCSLGMLYQFGNGVQQDSTRAAALYQQAADHTQHDNSAHDSQHNDPAWYCGSRQHAAVRIILRPTPIRKAQRRRESRSEDRCCTLTHLRLLLLLLVASRCGIVLPATGSPQQHYYYLRSSKFPRSKFPHSKFQTASSV
jgi:hypothetical protein